MSVGDSNSNPLTKSSLSDHSNEVGPRWWLFWCVVVPLSLAPSWHQCASCSSRKFVPQTVVRNQSRSLWITDCTQKIYGAYRSAYERSACTTSCATRKPDSAAPSIKPRQFFALSALAKKHLPSRVCNAFKYLVIGNGRSSGPFGGNTSPTQTTDHPRRCATTWSSPVRLSGAGQRFRRKMRVYGEVSRVWAARPIVVPEPQAARFGTDGGQERGGSPSSGRRPIPFAGHLDARAGKRKVTLTRAIHCGAPSGRFTRS